jgi:hypothetical protein
MLRIFTPEKIRRLRPGLNPHASMLTTRPPKPLLSWVTRNVNSIFFSDVLYVLSSVAYLSQPCLSTLSDKQYDFRKQFIEHEVCILILSKRLSVTFLILRRTQRHMFINVHTYSIMCPLFLPDINQT